MDRTALVISAIVLQACAAPVSRAARAGIATAGASAVATPGATPAVASPGAVAPAADAPNAASPAPGARSAAARASAAPAEEPDDAEIERRAEEDSAELREVHEAEVQRHVGDGRPGGGAPGSDAVKGPSEAVSALPEVPHGLGRLQDEYDIPLDVNDAVVTYVRYFQSPEIRPHFTRWLARYHRYAPRFREILREAGVPEDTVFLAMVESGFANLARSRARAVGPWQFIAETGRRFGLRQDFWIDERRDPEKASAAAARFLRQLHREHGDWRLAWAAYNAGPGRIARARKLGYSGFWEMARAKRVLPAETRAYVPKVMAAAIVTKHAEAFGFATGDVEPERWVEYAKVMVPRKTELSFLAKAAEVPIEVLLDLNPELRRTCTPPRRYALKIPRQAAPTFAANWPRISRMAARAAVARHRVRRGETLGGIAAAYGVRPALLERLNHLRSPSWIRAGSVLVVPLGPSARRGAEIAARRSFAASAKPVTVRVRRGDSLWSLARRFGVTVEELADWNGIDSPQSHTLPAGGTLFLVPPERDGGDG